MGKDGKQLEVVDETGQPVRVADRSEIHRGGLLHREVHVWLYTPKSEIIFQHRAKDKDTYPDLLDATVGGHVEIGMGWEDSAVKELEEETGLNVSEDQLTFITEIRSKAHDPVTDMTNNALRRVYAHPYDGSITELKIEAGKSLGFEAWLIKDLFNMSKQDAKRFIPSMLAPGTLEIFRKIQSLG